MSDQPKNVILDFETTGLDENEGEIIEIGAILVEGFQEVSSTRTAFTPIQGD